MKLITLLKNALRPAMEEVGRKFERGELRNLF
ncbi:MAG: B12-binding domain-containing protein [Candidatus Odinarchaeota archaeon]|nr:B12-binding domain-containing protein [Candidatus Odinarchaeota archaeon]